MDNSLRVFQSEQFGTIRTLDEDGKIYFCGLDAANALGYAKPRNAIQAHCRYALKRGVPHPQAPDKTLEMLFIPEGDLYRLITHSRLPVAVVFEKWVFDEVLPTIRRMGTYNMETAYNQPTYLVETMVRCVEQFGKCVDDLSSRITQLEQTNDRYASFYRAQEICRFPQSTEIELFSVSSTAQLLLRVLRELEQSIPYAFGEVQISNRRLCQLLGIKSKQTLMAARKELVEAGYIKFSPGVKGKPSIYHLK